MSSEPTCTSDYCDRPAVAAVYIHEPALTSDPDELPTILIRPDHMAKLELAVLNWRCPDCLHHDIDTALGLVAKEPA